MKLKQSATAFGAAIFSYSILPSYILRKIQTAKRKRCNERILYLTFDDGPSREYTPQLLDLLDTYQICASFFVVAEFAESHLDLIHCIKKRGHLIGIHSVNHKNALFRGNQFVKKDLSASLTVLKQLGCNVSYYRPPWGQLNLFTLYWVHKMRLKLIFWDVMAQDWSARESVTTIADKILHRVFPGAVICLHDGRGTDGAPGRTVKALEKALPILLAQGYQFERLDAYE